MNNIRSVADLDVAGQRVFVRVDFNVPLTGNGEVADDARLVAALPTIKYLVERGAKVVLAAHLGRPLRRSKDSSLMPIAERLAELLAPLCKELRLTDEPVGDGARKVVTDLRDGEVVLLENLRWHPGEEKNDESFAQKLAAFADLYVNEAFSCAHRAHASTVGMVRHFAANKKAAGFLYKRELEQLGRLQRDARRPYVAVVGGAKLSDKIGLLEGLATVADAILIGGAMANTFLLAQGKAVGRSLVEADRLHVARNFLKTAEVTRVKVLLPTDVVIAAGPDSPAARVVSVDEIGDDLMALDIGPQTVERFVARIGGAATVFWNGPLGRSEKPVFSHGTLAMAQALGDSRGQTVVSGDDTVAALHQAGVAERLTHVSTAGAAGLAVIEGQDLPGVTVLRTAVASEPSANEKRSAG